MRQVDFFFEINIDTLRTINVSFPRRQESRFIFAFFRKLQNGKLNSQTWIPDQVRNDTRIHEFSSISY